MVFDGLLFGNACSHVETGPPLPLATKYAGLEETSLQETEYFEMTGGSFSVVLWRNELERFEMSCWKTNRQTPNQLLPQRQDAQATHYSLFSIPLFSGQKWGPAWEGSQSEREKNVPGYSNILFFSLFLAHSLQTFYHPE